MVWMGRLQSWEPKLVRSKAIADASMPRRARRRTHLFFGVLHLGVLDEVAAWGGVGRRRGRPHTSGISTE
jgi:hypothetical protein